LPELLYRSPGRSWSMACRHGMPRSAGSTSSRTGISCSGLPLRRSPPRSGSVTSPALKFRTVWDRSWSHWESTTSGPGRCRCFPADEYDSHLDGYRAGEIARIIRKTGTPYIIHCTQDTDAAAGGDAVIFLKEGKIRSAGTPEDVFASLAGTAYYPLSWRCRV
jgi:hypothetical protein